MAISKPFAYNPSFSIGSGFGGGSVQTVKIQSDGKILVGGYFTTYQGASQNYLIRLNSDGSKDTSFNIGSAFNGGVGYNGMAIQSDGKILVGGWFTTFTGSTQNYLIRLNTDGSKDTSFNIGTGFNGGVESIVIQSNGKILVGGSFTTYTGSTQSGLIRLNTDGSKDISFDIGSGFDIFGQGGVFTVEVQSDGKVLVGGYYTTFNGLSQIYLIRLNTDGSKDSTFSNGMTSAGQSYVQIIKVDSNQKILVGGAFTTYSGSSQNRLIRLNSDGSKDTSFNIGTGFDYSGFFEYPDVFAIAIQSDGKIVVGGNFPQFTGTTQNRIIRLNSDGSKDTSFNIGTGFDPQVNSIEIDSNQNILVGGSFTTYTGSTQNGLVRLSSNGSFALVPSISGTTQYGSIVVGNIQTEYSLNYGGIKWWGGPDEELGYVVGNARPGGQPVPAGVTGGPAYVGFWRSQLLTDNSFLSLANYIGAQNSEPPFATTSAAVTWLNDNGYYTSYNAVLQSYYFGGDFTGYNVIDINDLISLNTNGSQNTSFNIGSGFNSDVFSLGIDSNEKILIGGSFTSFSGSSQNRLIRLSTNGSKDTSFNIGNGFNSTVNSIGIQSDGKILVGGQFTTFTGSSQNNLIRLNSDGSKDSTFDVGDGFSDTVRSISIQSDGKIITGGGFTTFTGSSENFLIRLNSNGSKDETFNIGSGFDNGVWSTSIQSDGKILVGGYFTTFTGSSQNSLIRLNSNGSKDSTFNIGSGFNGGAFAIVIDSNGKILVGGDFTEFSGISQNRLVRLNADGSKDTTFDIGTGFDIPTGFFTGSVDSISIDSNGKIICSGIFGSYSGVSKNYLVRLNTDGSIDNSFDIGLGFVGNYFGNYASINATKINSAGKIFVGGQFIKYGGTLSYKLLKVNSNLTTINENFNIGSGFNDLIFSMGVQSDEKILAGGTFTTFSDSSQNYLIRLNTDGSKDTSFNIGSGFNAGIFSIKIQSDEKVLIGGDFITFTGSSQNYLIRLNTDGSKDTSFNIGSGFNAGVLSIEIQSDDKILVGGNYTTFTGSAQNKLIRLNSNGSKDSTFNIGTGFDGNGILSIAIQTDGKILVGGDYTTFTGSSQGRLIRLNSDGSKDTTFNIGDGFNGTVNSTSIQSDGKVIVGGIFSTFTGSSQGRLIRLNSDGSKDSTFNIGTGFDADVFSTSIQSDGKILVGGSFTTYNGSSALYNVLLNSDGSFNSSIRPNNAVRVIKS